MFNGHSNLRFLKEKSLLNGSKQPLYSRNRENRSEKIKSSTCETPPLKSQRLR